ncbi:MAG: cellulase family glycosylhydrolase [Methyloversatilis discipulorum]|uniref:cellulase family glycosylhydrolase n=1 Tax=Methyloversatilis discipulorum TaxID=1119528 RepID=UPI0026EC1217|nr:cellulase family glycosylhydrolase [Methyloversatilis discipulorum]MBT9515664.1 cellulase family glycosylhydrolase [Methyloversatilis discipulorum]
MMALLMSVLASGAQAGTILDQFEDPDLTGWSIYRIPATSDVGSISPVAGYLGSGGLALNYNFTCTTVDTTCGQAAAAVFTLPQAMTPGVGIGFMTRSSPEVTLYVRVLDESGQTLQYRAPRPLQGFDPQAWYSVAIDLSKPTSYWGGANSGAIQGKVKAIWVLGESRIGRSISGVVSIDDLVMLTALPAERVLTYVNGKALLDGFDNRTMVEPWSFAKSSVAGTAGSVVSGAGHSSTRGLALNYGFTCATVGANCGQYVMAQLELSEPLVAGLGLRFMTRSSPEITLFARVVDESGQTLQYRVARTVEGIDPAVWYEAAIDFALPMGHWGGANSGRIQGKLKAIQIVAESRVGRAISGAVLIDTVSMSSELPAARTLSYTNGRFLLDGLDTRAIYEPWSFGKSGTGTSGGLSLVTGHASTRALGLNYGFTCTTAGSSCGQSVTATLNLEQALPAGGGISLMTRSPASVRLVLRVLDTSGQTLQYALARPSEGSDGMTWYEASADLSKPSSYWGGANSGSISGYVRAITVLVESTGGVATSGSVSIDSLSMLQLAPLPSFVAGKAVLDSAESPNLPGWSFTSLGNGVGGAIEGAAGYASTQSIGLNYAFTCIAGEATCNRAAAAVFTLPQAMTPGVGIGFMTRSSPEVTLYVRVLDESGQTLQYRAPRPLQGFDPQAWYSVAIDLSKPTSYWGGANSGAIQGKVKAIWVLGESRIGRSISGVVSIDDLVMLTALPAERVLTYVNGKALLDGFDNRTMVEPWSFAKSSVAGTAGSVVSGAGHSSTRGLALNYGFTCATVGANCGQYVMAQLELSEPLVAGLGLRFMTRSSPEITLFARVVDESGQTLQYRVARTVEGIDPAVWYEAAIDFALPMGHWGGANSGRIQGKLKAIQIVAESRVGRAISGAVLIDTVSMSSELPAARTLSYTNGRFLLDGLDTRAIYEPWSFGKSGTGTSGGLSLVTGHASTRALGLNYGFTCTTAGSSCGQSVTATLNLEQALPAGAVISFMTRSPVHTQLSLRVIDESGQTLQYRLIRPLEGYDPVVWYQVHVDLAKPSTYWGGANSGVIFGRLIAISVLVESGVDQQVSGTVSLDAITMLSTAPELQEKAFSDGALSIDTFDSREVAAPWVSGTSDARTTASVAIAEGYSSRNALSLAYSFSCESSNSCGTYAVADFSLPFPHQAGAAFQMRVKHAADVKLKLRVRDQTGQTLQYEVERTLEGQYPDRWYLANVRLDTPETYWGGSQTGRIGGSVVGVSLIVENTLQIPGAGTALFDDLRVVEMPIDSHFIDLQAVSLIAPPTTARLVGNRFGVANHTRTISTPYEKASSAGLSFVRMDLKWEAIEVDGFFNFSHFDTALSLAEANGLGMLFIIDYGHPSYDLSTVDGMKGFGRFAEEAARRYAGRNVRFEIWNEPDHPQFWFGNPNPIEYANLCKIAVAAIRKVNPSAIVSTGGLTKFNFSYLKAMLNSGGATNFDAISVHSYEEDTPELIVDGVVMSRELIERATGREYPLWMTESGFSNGRVPGLASSIEFQEIQAQYLTRKMLTFWALDLPLAVWYSLVDRGIDPIEREDNFGMLFNDFSDKPSINAMRVFSDNLGSQTYMGLHDHLPPNMHAMSFENSTDRTLVVWQDGLGKTGRISISSNKLIDAQDYLGRTITGDWGSDGLVSFELTDLGGPVYIKFRK